MPRHCSAGGCRTRDTRQTRKAGVSFHKLPKEPGRRRLWIQNSDRADSWDPQTAFVYFCSKHFTPQSFELTGCSGIKRLKDDALPTVFQLPMTARGRRAAARQKPAEDPVHKKKKSRLKTLQAPTAEEDPPGPPQVSIKPEPQGSPPPPESPPPSPSRYMRRLPPPPGFYLSKEHTYAQSCPLLWRRRYDQVVDYLEKTLRQLRATKQRESRLRGLVLRMKNQDGGKARERRRSPPGHPDEEGGVAPSEEGRVGGAEAGAGAPDAGSWSEEAGGCCLYCGRGPEQRGGQGGGKLPKRRRGVQPSEGGDSPQPQAGSDASRQRAVKKRAARKTAKSSRKEETTPQSTGVPQQGAELLASDGWEELLWFESESEGQFILVPIQDAADGTPSILQADGAPTILVSGLVEAGQANGVGAEPREDVRERLKEHLEGFHLQLSTEFTN